MGAYKFLLTMLRKNCKRNIVYFVSFIFPIAIIFNLMNIINNDNFFPNASVSGQNIAADVIFLLVLLVCVFSFYSNAYYMLRKSKEMGIIELSGIGSSKLGRMMVFENFVIETIEAAAGILLGIVLMPAFMSVMYLAVGKRGSVFAISLVGMWGTIAIIFLQLVYVGVGDYAYVSTREVIDLIGVDKQTRINKSVKNSTFLSFISLIVYLVPVICIFFRQAYIFTLDNIVFTLFGILGVLRKLIPQLILGLKKRKYANDKIKLVALSNLYLSIKQLAFLLITLAVSVEILFIIISFFPLAQVRTVCMLSYITIVLLIALSIVYKALIDANAKKRIFYQLSLTGYTLEQINKIIKSEFIIYYSIVIVIPLIPILSFMIIFKVLGIISMTIIMSMLGIFIVVFLITGIVSYTIYKKISIEKNAYRFF